MVGAAISLAESLKVKLLADSTNLSPAGLYWLVPSGFGSLKLLFLFLSQDQDFSSIPYLITIWLVSRASPSPDQKTRILVALFSFRALFSGLWQPACAGNWSLELWEVCDSLSTTWPALQYQVIAQNVLELHHDKRDYFSSSFWQTSTQWKGASPWIWVWCLKF